MLFSIALRALSSSGLGLRSLKSLGLLSLGPVKLRLLVELIFLRRLPLLLTLGMVSFWLVVLPLLTLAEVGLTLVGVPAALALLSCSLDIRLLDPGLSFEVLEELISLK